jgi:indolepyruvate ferredoxin oxidoreductase beta subunit
MLRKDGIVLIGEFKIPPLTVSSGDDVYPGDEVILEIMEQVTQEITFVPTLTLAEEAGTTRAHNVVLLGALSTKIEEVAREIWLEVIEERVPKKYIELNRNAFQMGRESALVAA